MDAKYTGSVIAEARKARGITQKQLAERLGVTDKAVSKWERGINYPDIELFKPLAQILDIPILRLLSGEDVESEQVIEMTAQISVEEKRKLRRELKMRWILNIIITLGIVAAEIWLSYILADKGLFGKYQVLSGGLIGFQGVVIGNSLYSLRNLKNICPKGDM